MQNSGILFAHFKQNSISALSPTYNVSYTFLTYVFPLHICMLYITSTISDTSVNIPDNLFVFTV